MSKHHSKRKKKRENLPKKRGAKRCPSCNCNTLRDGHCSCGYGKQPVMDLDNHTILQQIAPVAIAIPVILNRRKKQRKENEDK